MERENSSVDNTGFRNFLAEYYLSILPFFPFFFFQGSITYRYTLTICHFSASSVSRLHFLPLYWFFLSLYFISPPFSPSKEEMDIDLYSWKSLSSISQSFPAENLDFPKTCETTSARNKFRLLLRRRIPLLRKNRGGNFFSTSELRFERNWREVS